jgi:hypothetical protein
MGSLGRLWLLLVVTTILGCTGCTIPTQRPQPKPTPKPVPSTPLARFLTSGKALFPTYRIVAYYGEADVPAMGVLGSGAPAAVGKRLLRQASAYAKYKRPVIPAFELIAVPAQQAPGAADTYHAEIDAATIQRYLAEARRISALLVLDIQPGRATFLPLVKHYAQFLREPDVGLALDPEWEMDAGQIPGEEIGGTTGVEVNGVAQYLASIVREHRLPQKLFVIHQFTPDMIEHRNVIRALPELATTFHIDGFGARPNKLSKYNLLASRDVRFHNGIKLFYEQDINMFSPSNVMGLRPQSDLITYQ